jgi:hypothetical protein
MVKKGGRLSNNYSPRQGEPYLYLGIGIGFHYAMEFRNEYELGSDIQNVFNKEGAKDRMEAVLSAKSASDFKEQLLADAERPFYSPKSSPPSLPSGPWTNEKNARRCALIDRKIAETLTDEEAIELADLQEEMLRHRRKVAPLPLEDLRQLHQELLQMSMEDPR